MLNTSNCSDTMVTFILIVILLVVMYIYVWPVVVYKLKCLLCKTPKNEEGFTSAKNVVDNTVPVDYKQNDIDIIQPPVYNAYDETIQSGSLFIPQPVYYTTQGDKVELGNVDAADVNKVNNISDAGMNFNMCSPACCSDQWPLPFKIPVDKMTCSSTDEFVPTSYFCNNGWQDSGCLCMKKDQSDFINARGNNTDL